MFAASKHRNDSCQNSCGIGERNPQQVSRLKMQKCIFVARGESCSPRGIEILAAVFQNTSFAANKKLAASQQKRTEKKSRFTKSCDAASLKSALSYSTSDPYDPVCLSIKCLYAFQHPIYTDGRTIGFAVLFSFMYCRSFSLTSSIVSFRWHSYNCGRPNSFLEYEFKVISPIIW